MDHSSLVASGQTLTSLMDKAGIAPRAVFWVFSTDTGAWRLWVVPPTDLKDKHDFYRQLSVIVSHHRLELGGIDASDVEMVSDDHPAVKGLGRLFRVQGVSDVHISQNMLDGFYIPDGIILRMAL